MRREYTNKFLQRVEDGELDAEEMLKLTLRWMGEELVQEMLEDNDLLEEMFESEDDDYENDRYED